jgi:hypothetical protein
MKARGLALAALLGACATAPPASESPEGLFFPRHDAPYGEGDLAGLEGVVAFRDGCLWIDANSGERFLPIWPANTSPGVINSLPVVLVEDAQLLLETGEVRNFAGSQVDAARAEELAGPIPEPCASESFWAVTQVDRLR